FIETARDQFYKFGYGNGTNLYSTNIRRGMIDISNFLTKIIEQKPNLQTNIKYYENHLNQLKYYKRAVKFEVPSNEPYQKYDWIEFDEFIRVHDRKVFISSYLNVPSIPQELAYIRDGRAYIDLTPNIDF